MTTYKESGVDKHEGYRSVALIEKHIAKTQNSKVMNSIGAFASLYDLSGYKNPVLVSGTDGVGTKLEIAIKTKKYDTIGIDCVAMCVNDILCHGAKPLLFLDYFATGKLVAENLEQVVKGIADGCADAKCALVGGETAEMPGFYRNNDFDLAGFCVGVIEKENIIDINHISERDVVIGIASSGLHSNGFSLVRKMFPDIHQDFQGKPLYEELLKPTTIYHQALEEVLERKLIKGLAHITGGGLYENVPRTIPEGLGAVIEKKNMSIPKIFKTIMELGVPEEEMFGTFNMGVGMVVICRPDDASLVQESINQKGYSANIIGTIEKNSKKICLK